MANFNVGDLGGVESPFTPEQPIVDDTASHLLGFASNSLEVFGQGREAKAADKANSFLDSFTQENLRLADAVDQGRMSSQAARMFMRSVYSQYLSSAPGMADELADRQKTIISQAGLGKVIADGTAQEKANIKLEQDGIGEGFIDPSAGDEARFDQLQEYRRLVRARQHNLDIQAGLSTRTQRNSLEESQLRQEHRRALFEVSSAATPKFRRDMLGLVESVNNGDMTPEEAIATAENQWNSIQSVVSSVGTMAGSENINSLVSPMRDMFEVAVSRMKGEVELEVLQNRMEKSMALSTMSWMEDPTLRDIAAGSKLLPNADILQVWPQLTDSVMKHMRRNDNPDLDNAGNLSNPFSTDEEDVKSMEVYNQILKDNLRLWSRGDLGEDGEGQLETHLRNTIRSVSAFSSAVGDPTSFRSFMKLLATPEMGRWMTEKGGVMADIAQDSQDIVTAHYSEVVLPLLKEEYEKSSTIAFSRDQGHVTGIPGAWGSRPSRGVVTPDTDVIKPEFLGSGVVFRVDPNSELAGVPRVVAKVKELNRKVSPILNELIMVESHLGGNQNYRQTYERLYGSVFGEDLPEGQSTSPATPAPSQQSGQEVLPIPSVGDTVDGYRYLGGDVNSRSSWRRVDE